MQGQPAHPALLQRVIFLNLHYVDGTPEDYEPPGFKARDETPIHWDKKPFAMCALWQRVPCIPAPSSCRVWAEVVRAR